MDIDTRPTLHPPPDRNQAARHLHDTELSGSDLPKRRGTDCRVTAAGWRPASDADLSDAIGIKGPDVRRPGVRLGFSRRAAVTQPSGGAACRAWCSQRGVACTGGGRTCHRRCTDVSGLHRAVQGRHPPCGYAAVILDAARPRPRRCSPTSRRLTAAQALPWSPTDALRRISSKPKPQASSAE